MHFNERKKNSVAKVRTCQETACSNLSWNIWCLISLFIDHCWINENLLLGSSVHRCPTRFWRASVSLTPLASCRELNREWAEVRPTLKVRCQWCREKEETPPSNNCTHLHWSPCTMLIICQKIPLQYRTTETVVLRSSVNSSYYGGIKLN